MLPATKHPRLSDRPFMRARFPSLHDVRNEARRAMVNSMRMLQLIAGDPDEDGVIDPREQRLAATALLRSVPGALKSLDRIEEQLAASSESTDPPESPPSSSSGRSSADNPAGAPASDPSDASSSRPGFDSATADATFNSNEPEISEADPGTHADTGNCDDPDSPPTPAASAGNDTHRSAPAPGPDQPRTHEEAAPDPPAVPAPAAAAACLPGGAPYFLGDSNRDRWLAARRR